MQSNNVFLIVMLLFLMSCSTDVDNKEFIRKVDFILETDFSGFSSIDTSIVLKTLGGDFETYKKTIVQNRKNFVSNYTWHRAGKYLSVKENEAKKIGEIFGFTSPYYFIEFLRDDKEISKLKTELKAKLIKHCTKNGIEVSDNTSFSELMDKLFLNTLENVCGSNCKCVKK